MTLDINEMTQKELDRIVEENNILHENIINLQSQLESVQNKNQRKSQVLELLRNNQTISILELANKIDISTKNVSSQLTYLRNDGYKIYTDHNGRKLLIEDEKEESSE